MSQNLPVKMQFGAVDRLSKTIGKFQRKFPELDRSVRRTNNSFRIMQKNTEKLRGNLSAAGRGFKDAGRSMTMGLTLPIAAFGASAINTAVKFEKSMNKVEALSGATGDSLGKLRDMAKDLGSTTQFSASEAADAMGFLSMAGFSVNETLAATPSLLNLAAASSTDLGRSADIASNILGAFGMKATETGRVADVLASTTASANVNMEEMAEAMKDAAPVAQKFGLSIEETSSAIGLLGNIGIKGSKAGTALRNMMLQLASPTSEVTKMMKAMGVSAVDPATGKLRSLEGIMKDLGPAISNLPEAKQLSALEAIFGRRAIAGASELVTQSLKLGDDGKTSIERFTESLGNAEGASERMAKTMMKGAPGAVKSLSSAFEGLQLAVTESGLLEAFVFMIQKLTAMVRWLSQLNPTILKWATVIASVLAVLGPLVWMVGSFLSAASTLITVINAITAVFIGLGTKGLILVLLPFIKIIAIVGIIAGLGYLIIKNWEPLKEFFSDLLDGAIDKMTRVIGLAKKVGSSIGSFFGFGGDDEEPARKGRGGMASNMNRINKDENRNTLDIGKIKSRNPEFQSRESRAKVDMRFSNLPKDARISQNDPDEILDINTGLLEGI